jgi:hypothetical protein
MQQLLQFDAALVRVVGQLVKIVDLDLGDDRTGQPVPQAGQGFVGRPAFLALTAAAACLQRVDDRQQRLGQTRRQDDLARMRIDRDNAAFGVLDRRPLWRLDRNRLLGLLALILDGDFDLGRGRRRLLYIDIYVDLGPLHL